MEGVLPRIAEMQGAIWVKRQRRKRQKRLVSELLKDYARHSTLHGLRYVTEPELTVFEKVFWMITFLVSVAACCYLITNIYEKWKTSPVIVTLGERPVSAGIIPFPAVTICPQLKCKKTVYDFSKQTENFLNDSKKNTISRVDMEQFEDISMLCQYYNSDGTNKTRVSNMTIIDHINTVSPTLEETLIECQLSGKQECNRSALFSESFTSEGKCFTYNGISARDLYRDDVTANTQGTTPIRGWSHQNGYSDNETKPYPVRGMLNSDEPDITIMMRNFVEDEDPLCNGLRSGYRIYLSHPADAPQASLYYYAALDGQLTSLAVHADIFTAPESLRKYSTVQRQCYFYDEKYLSYFKLYTFSNCVLECLSNMTQSECGCVGFNMPYKTSANVTICTVYHKLSCLSKAHKKMVDHELRAERDPLLPACRCMPSCDSVEYDAEVLKTEFKLSDLIENEMKVVWGYKLNIKNETRFSAIELYFKKPQFRSMHRSELFGTTDFIANIGGLLGVFLGFSFLSLVEILYFIFIRIGFTLKRDLAVERKMSVD